MGNDHWSQVPGTGKAVETERLKEMKARVFDMGSIGHTFWSLLMAQLPRLLL